MKKAAYGLKDASRKFWQRMMDLLLKLGCKPIVGDETLLYYHSKQGLEGVIGLHVDDILGGGTPNFKEKMMDVVENTFACSKRESNIFRYTGAYIELQNSGEILISQLDYVDNLKEIDVDKSSDNRRPLTRKEFKEF